jgi:hypothetical protein
MPKQARRYFIYLKLVYGCLLEKYQGNRGDLREDKVLPSSCAGAPQKLHHSFAM